MPKDYIQTSLGLQEFSVLGCKEDKSGVVVEVLKTLPYGVCPRCGESTNKVHQYRIRSIDDIPIQGKRLQLKLKQRRFTCASCGKVFTERFESIKSRAHRTIRYEQYLYELCKNRALKDIAAEYQIKYTTLRRLRFLCAKEVSDNRPA
jgi:transposase